MNQNARQKQLIDKLLALICVEKQQHLSAPLPVSLRELAAHNLSLVVDVVNVALPGDVLLLRQALATCSTTRSTFRRQEAQLNCGAIVTGARWRFRWRRHRQSEGLTEHSPGRWTGRQ